MAIITLIAAMSDNRVIGKDNKIPWHIPEDFKYFKERTSGMPVIMGRKTWDSLPRKPLPKRLNIVISRDRDYVAEGAVVCQDMQNAIYEALKAGTAEIFIMGGTQIYDMALKDNVVDKIYLTHIREFVEGDSYFPELDLTKWSQEKGKLQKDDNYSYSFDLYTR